MKKFKIGLSLLMSLVMVFSVFSFGAFAATDTEIDTMAFEFNAKPGDKLEDCTDQLVIKTEGVGLSEALAEIGYSVLVMDETGALAGTYEMGESYVLVFCIEPEEGYTFPESDDGFKSVTVNGEPAEVIVVSEDVLSVTITVNVVMFELAIGGTIESLDASLSIYGDMLVGDWYRYLKVNSQGVEPLDGDIDAVRAYDKDGNPVIGEFVAGEEYTLEVYLSAKKNCEFKKNDAGEVSLDSATLNGNDIAYTAGTYQYEGTQYEYLKLETTVTAKEPKYIETVDVTLSENLEGMPVIQWKDYVSINTEGLGFLGDDYYSVEVYDYFGNFIYDSFEEGTVYTIYICLKAEEGYFFPADEVLDSVKLNGEEAVYYCYTDSETGETGIVILAEVDMVDGIWAQIMFFFQKIAYWFQNLFFGFIL